MIGSVPRAGLGQLSDGRRGSDGAPEGSVPVDLFAQLLGGGAQMPGPDFASPEIQALPETAGPALPAPPIPAPPADLRDEPPAAPVARVFNQDGLFGHAGDPDGEAIELGEAEGATTAVMPGAPDAAVETAEPAAPGPNRGHVAVVRDAPPVEDRSPASRPARPAPFRATAPAASLDRTESPAPAEAEETQLSSPVTRRQLRDFGAARSPLRVEVSEVEQGLQVAARVEGMDEAERRQLRDAIAALLARHGLSPARIDIFAAPLRENDQ